MIKTFILTMFCLLAYSSLTQTIVWKQLTSLPEGYYCGEAILSACNHFQRRTTNMGNALKVNQIMKNVKLR